ncbi:OmpH family outer membrane protein, partial [bacterium]|nr:OmpH family outer membrane protein [bacterium]
MKTRSNTAAMKKIIIMTVIVLAASLSGMAQKFAFVDSEYIRNNIPAFTAAQQQLDKLSEGWEKEVADGYAEVEQMYKDYQASVVLLTQDQKKKKEEAIIAREKEIKDLQNRYFGMEGELYKKREELVKPIQDEILKAIKEISVEGSYAVIFDTSAGSN